MPLERVMVRNEYGLGSSEVYKEASSQEDPKALLEGLAVSGLVGILRQLGDLAEFAAEVFHGLQEQVMTTSSRSHRLMVRVQNIEAALPSIEKAVLAQTSHIHFSYTAGSEWHPRINNEQNHFIYNDLPRFIMDSYEECRDPPRLQMLDKFDSGGPGSCLKRYSDPTFFRRVSGSFKESNVDKVRKDKKARKNKKKRSSRRNGELRAASMSNLSGRMQFATPFGNGRSSPTYTTSTFDMTLKSDVGDRSNSSESRMGSGYIEHVFHSNSTAPQEEHDSSQVISRFVEHDDIHVPAYRDGHHGIVDENLAQSSSPGHIAGGCVAWDEKEEVMEPGFQHFELNEGPEILTFDSDMDMLDDVNPNPGNSDMEMRDDVHSNHRNSDMDMPDGVNPDPRNSDMDMLSDVNSDGHRNSDMDLPEDLADSESTPKSSSTVDQLDEVESEPDNYLDALNTIESESESDLDFQTKREVPQVPSVTSNETREHKMCTGESQTLDHHPDKNELNISSGISSKIEASANPVSSDSSEHEETFRIPGSSSISESLPVTADSRRTITLDDDAKLDSSDSCLTSSGSPTENAREPLQDNNSYKSQESMVENRGGISGNTYEESLVGFSGGTSSSNLRESILQNTLDASVGKSQEFMAEGSVDASVSKTQTEVERSGVASVSRSLESMVECSVDASVSKTQELIIGCSMDETFSKSQISTAECSEDASVSKFQPKVDLFDVTPVTIWTNGGLLGLEPSKPPDFAMSAAARQDLVIKSKVDAADPSNHKLTSGDVGEGVKLTPASGIVERDAKNDKSSSSQESCSYGDDFYAGVLQPTSRTEKDVPRAADIKVSSREARLANDESSSRVFGLVSGLRRTLSLGSDGKTELVSSLRTNVEEQSSGNDRSKVHASSGKAYDEKFRWNLMYDSPSSSPPLEHMRISFRPADGFDASKLKLKFPNGSQSNGSVRDAFSSFQLVPENGVAHHDVVSDSDDDTFCRSSPYMSYDCLSHKSDEDSELWESEGPESTSPSRRTGEAGINGIDSSLSTTILDLPSFDSMSTQPTHDLDSHQAKEGAPSPPPLPPAQWRGSQTPFDEFEDQKPSIAEVQTSAEVLPGRDLTELMMNSKPALAAAKQPIQEKSHSFRFSKDEHKVTQKEAFQPASIKDSDDKDDFLNQIRTKSFSLRRPATAKPVLTSGPANDKVTAILKKANAIRQAVGSDDGDEDDDNWSE